MYFEKAELTCPILFKKPVGILGVDYNIFDGYVSINENVTEHNNSTFSLNVLPVNEVRVLHLGKTEKKGGWWTKKSKRLPNNKMREVLNNLVKVYIDEYKGFAGGPENNNELICDFV